MKKRIVSILMALCMLVGLFSVAIQAVGTFTYTIQVIIVDADGKLVSVNGLPSKEFDGTTDSGSSYNEDWQWQPNSDGGYTITSNAPGTNVNAFGHLKYPTALWDYDTNDYQFIGMGNMSWDYTNRYEFSEAELSYDWKFENCSFVFSVKSGYRTYILQEKGPAEVEYILNYDANGGEGAPQSQTVKSSTGSATFTVSDVEPTRDGYDFLGWAETDTATSAQYSGGDNYVTSKTNSTLYAVWKVKTIPEPPTKDEIEDLLKDSAVKVDCINSEVIHNDMVYGLLPDSYSIGNVVEGANGNYTIVITVLPDKYVEKYNETYSGHTLSPNPQSETITLEYIGNDWEIASNNSLPVIFTVICTTTTPNPSINDFTKERLTEAPDDVFLDLGDVTVNYNNPVVIPEGGSVTLLYKLTVTGDQGANFIITDDGATLVGSDCGATQATDGKISGTIPASGDANVYVTKTFDADDIDNGNLKNTANIDAGQDTEIDSNVGDAEVNTPASEDTSGIGDDLSINGFTKERLTAAPTGVSLDLDNVTVNYDDPVVIPNGGSVTLLYKLTVTGDQGANFIITDDGATLVGSDCGATQATDGKISGTIPASGDANVYVTKTFDADDIDNGNLKNAANIDAGQDTEIDSNVGDATVDTPASEESTPTNEFTLTYDGNAQANGTVENIPSNNNKYVTGDEVSLTVSPEPIHTAVNGSDVIFIGWSLDDADKIYAAGEAYPDIVTEVTFTDSSITVHAVWGYDTNDDDIPDVDQVLVTPADITIYVGGSGYTGAVDGTGDVVTSSGLPEPGFYVTLPAELDALLKTNEGHMGNGPLDLSNKIIFEANVSGSPLKSWSIEKYDKDNSSTVTIGGIERYIYRIVPAKDQDPVRMQFRDDDGITISDQFNISLDTLYNEYEMSIYPGAIDSNTLYARCVNDSYSDEHYSLVTTSGILTIRGVVNDNVVTTEIEENLPADSDNVTAIAANGTEYFINGSNLVTNSAADVKLLVDDLVESGKNELKDYIIKADNGIDDNFEFEFKYLDLVDTSNGNVWIRPSNDMTIFWPYPEGTDKYTDFAIVHFDGLSRNYDDLDTALDKNDPEYLNVTKTDSGITFTVSSFSPFALVWSTDDSSDDEDDENNPPIIIPINNKLIITKTVSGNLADENDEFLFMIELDRKINGNYDGVIFVDGKAYVTLKGGESVIINDLAPGTAYKVTELDSGEYTVTSTNEIGTIPYTGSVYVNFDNYLNIDAPGLNTTDHIGYLIGRAPGLIFPDANMTRAEVATVFFRLLTDEARAENWTQENQYSDVELNDWYNNAISTISAMGIMNGYPDGTFLPDSPITRAEFITTAVRFFDYTAEYFEGTFIDVDGSEWFADYVAAGVELGMIEGYPDGSFLPNEPILRCEVAAIVNRTLGRVPDEAHLLDTSEMIIWDDNLPGSWYYAHIQEASNSHDVEWVVEDGELVEQWTEKLDERDWAALERAWSDAYSAPGAEVVD